MNRLIALAFAAIIGTLLYLGLTRTRLGTALRAVAVDPVAAQLVAIDVRRASAFAFALGGALVATGGVLVSMFLTLQRLHGRGLHHEGADRGDHGRQSAISSARSPPGCSWASPRRSWRGWSIPA